MSVYKEEHFGIARKIVSNMTSESWEKIPHATFSYEADATELMKEYKKLNSHRSYDKITINTVVIKIICEGLIAAPKMNCTLDFNRKLVRGCLRYHDTIDISMPVLFPNGEMMTVNMHDMGNKTLLDMTAAISDTYRRAVDSDMNEAMFEVSMDNTIKALKKGKIRQTLYRLIGSKTGKHKVKTLSGKERRAYYKIPETERLTFKDIEQGTTTITNIGAIYRGQRGECFMLEIIPPQVSAFAINAVQKRPSVVTDENGNDVIEVRQILPITIAIDHRALDFGDVLPFFKRLDEIFAQPSIIHEWK